MTGPAPESSPGADRATGAGHPTPPAYDALVLAGGRARRLGGVSKPDVLVSGRRLLAHVLDAAAVGPGPRRTVVVAPASVAVPDGVLRTLEDPPDGGPVAGIAAGLAALGRSGADAVPGGRVPHGAGAGGPEVLSAAGASATGDGPAPWVLVLACDVPRAAGAVPHLLAACARGGAASGALLVDADGREQPLVGLYRRADLDRAVTELAASRGPDGVRGASVRALLAPLTLTRVPDDSSAAADVDTWEDVRALDGVVPPSADVALPAADVAPPGADAVARPGTRTDPRRWDDGDGLTAPAADLGPAPAAPSELSRPAAPDPRRYP
ncbi:molybdenum cofactor guanylyltransferase [Cellulomonas sp. NS3]|uniref:molybdenum cofactor guanylyltransferase n=1 Tax=Cellulomonas sp. NS3 TaxID=2973977 RepID=UPI0021638B25|nr:NTP transferase domain-containing protein [Cellulomonas sp. NS3]